MRNWGRHTPADRSTPTPPSSVDGLLVYDNIGGRDLALRIHAAEPWTRFEFLRAAWSSGPMALTWELTGAGEVWLDEVSVEVHDGRPLPTQSITPSRQAQRMP